MRNIFDQYKQPENRLTHALYCTLAHDRTLMRPFLLWLGVTKVPLLNELKIVEQRVPGSKVCDDDGEDSSLPDLCIYSDDDWAVFFEMKVQDSIDPKQLRRHKTTAKRYGFSSSQLVAITVDGVTAKMPAGTLCKQWRDLYAWFDRQHSRSKSFWAGTFVEYMETFESKAVAADYEVRGTITMFNGLRFSAENPYTYPAGRRLIRLLGDELQKREDLHRELGMDLKGRRRPAITNDELGVWDFLPLEKAQGAAFTKFPHLTMGIRETCAIAAVTVPNGVCGGFRTKLKRTEFKEFLELIQSIEHNLRRVVKLAEPSKPLMYAVQRHYRSMKSPQQVDGRLEVDLRTCVPATGSSVKYQPEWARSLYDLLVNKRSNIQFGIEMRLDYVNKAVQSPKVLDLFADSWKAMKPLLDFVLPSS